MIVVSTAEEVRRLTSGRSVLVPTMGALHEGHLALVEMASTLASEVVMSIFVNPLQFDRPEDLERYPRNLERDVRLADQAGVDIVFAPEVADMYPVAPLTTVAVAEVTETLEGIHRPGHFAGVATVVTKLLASLQPDAAIFGRKDHQQFLMIGRLAIDLSLPVDIVGHPIVRDPDGLALSSRNVFIEDRVSALTVSAGLMEAAAAIDDGERSGSALETIVRSNLDVDEIEYVALASQSRSRAIERIDEPAFLAVAVRVGPVRLIDNLPIDLIGEMWVPDLGQRLPHPSALARR